MIQQSNTGIVVVGIGIHHRFPRRSSSSSLLLLLCLVSALLTVLCIDGSSSSSSSSSSSTTIPRSRHRLTSISDGRNPFPPWNLSQNIDENGFLYQQYERIRGEWETEKMDHRQAEDEEMGEMEERWKKNKRKKKKNKNNRNNGRNKRRGRRQSDDEVDEEEDDDDDDYDDDDDEYHELFDEDDISRIPCTIRQVPGDGNCLFHSISTCHSYPVNGTHLDWRDEKNLSWLYENSARLRQLAVDCLEQKRKLLFLQGDEYVVSSELVDAAASQYRISGDEYCNLMRQDSYWGGGPEIVALCNVLQRPIHVYELYVKDHKFVLRRMACFGSPKFDANKSKLTNKNKQQRRKRRRRQDDDDVDDEYQYYYDDDHHHDHSPLHILSADSRFPDLRPGRQLSSGNHFLALFPDPVIRQQLIDEMMERIRKKKQKKKDRQEEEEEKKSSKRRLRGGDNDKNKNDEEKENGTDNVHIHHHHTSRRRRRYGHRNRLFHDDDDDDDEYDDNHDDDDDERNIQQQRRTNTGGKTSTSKSTWFKPFSPIGWFSSSKRRK